MRDNLVEQIISGVMNKQTDVLSEAKATANFAGCGITEFVSAALGHVISLVTANVDNQLHEIMNIDKKYHSIDILGTRTGAGPQIPAANEAIEATNSEIISIELTHDTEGDGGHGCLAIFGASGVSDVRYAIEAVPSEIECTMGDVYDSSAGHLKLRYTACASYALSKALGVPIGKSFEMTCISPTAIGLVIAGAVTKSTVTDPAGHASPSQGTSFSNEVIFTFSDDSGAVRQVVIAAHGVGL